MAEGIYSIDQRADFRCPPPHLEWPVCAGSVGPEAEAFAAIFFQRQLCCIAKALTETIPITAFMPHDQNGLRVMALFDQLPCCCIERGAAGGDVSALVEGVEGLPA